MGFVEDNRKLRNAFSAFYCIRNRSRLIIFPLALPQRPFADYKLNINYIYKKFSLLLFNNDICVILVPWNLTTIYLFFCH